MKNHTSNTPWWHTRIGWERNPDVGEHAKSYSKRKAGATSLPFPTETNRSTQAYR